GSGASRPEPCGNASRDRQFLATGWSRWPQAPPSTATATKASLFGRVGLSTLIPRFLVPQSWTATASRQIHPTVRQAGRELCARWRWLDELRAGLSEHGVQAQPGTRLPPRRRDRAWSAATRLSPRSPGSL